jgi:NDP-sugar pyrophosphorylase family protein
MKIVLLCGGVGQRIFPITEDKSLLKFLGKTLLEQQIETAVRAGLLHFIIIGNPQNIGKIEEIQKKIPGVSFENVVQEEPRGIANALESAKLLLNDEIIVQSANDLVDASAYERLIDARQHNSSLSYLLAYRINSYFPGGYVVINDKFELKDIIEKPGSGNEPSNLVNILVHLHTDPQKLLECIPRVHTIRDDVYENAIGCLVKDGFKIQVVPYSGNWGVIKYPWHIFGMLHLLLDESEPYISESAQISDKALIDGKVIIDDNARIMENVVIKGPVYIGPNSVIGNNCLVRDYSHIGANTVVGYSTEVKNSYIGDNCSFHHCYVGDSIIGDRCSFGFGTVFSNFRFDEKNIKIRVGGEIVDTGLNKLGAIVGPNSKTGVNVSIMPGVRIGANSIIGPNMCLARDLKPGQFISTKSSQRKNATRLNES